MNMILHDDGHTNVITADGLLSDKELQNKSGNNGFKYDNFDYILTNPPFGSIVKQSERAYLRNYDYAINEADWLNPKSKATFKGTQSTEILFIEQCHNFLKEGGYLAIVVPDGILTNSSAQYVRDDIEEKFRIIAIVSLPQTAFQATGAGVKSSVLFLKKHLKTTTNSIIKRKEAIKNRIISQNNYFKQIQQIEKEKKIHINEHRGLNNPQNIQGIELTQSDEYKTWKKEVSDSYMNKIDELREYQNELYLKQWRESLKNLYDYEILMAIAEDIGYDATGKSTGTNELEIISSELKRFIEMIERGDA